MKSHVDLSSGICLEDEIYGGHKNGGFELRIGLETTKAVLKAVLTLTVCSNMSTSELVMEENHERRKHTPRVESKVPTVRIASGRGLNAPRSGSSPRQFPSLAEEPDASRRPTPTSVSCT
jgi:hypothetical protein